MYNFLTALAGWRFDKPPIKPAETLENFAQLKTTCETEQTRTKCAKTGKKISENPAKIQENPSNHNNNKQEEL